MQGSESEWALLVMSTDMLRHLTNCIIIIIIITELFADIKNTRWQDIKSILFTHACNSVCYKTSVPDQCLSVIQWHSQQLALGGGGQEVRCRYQDPKGIKGRTGKGCSRLQLTRGVS